MERFFVNTLLCSIILHFTSLTEKTMGQKTAIMVKQQRSYAIEPIKLTTESFRNLISNSDILIDKSLFIKELLNHPEKRVIIACPAKWSKSINLCMLKSFLQVETDQHGNQVTPVNRTFAYKLFMHGRGSKFNRTKNFQTPFLISRHKAFLDKYLSQYPVIYVRCRFIEGRNRYEVMSQIKGLLRRVYLPHAYIMHDLIDLNENNTARRNEAENDFYRFQGILEGNEHDEEVLSGGIALLCKLLYRQHGKRVFVLIDDYDQPYYKALHSDLFSPSDVEFVTNIFKNLISPLVAADNQYVERVIMSANYYLTDLFDAIKTVPAYTLVNNPWIEYFASTDQEQLDLCQHLNITERRCQSVVSWYMGYRCVTNDRLNLGSPFSPACFFTNNDMKLNLFFKQRFDYLFLLIRTPIFKNIFDSLINDKNVTVESFNDLRFSVAEMQRLKEIAIADPPYNDLPASDVGLALSFLCASGYLTFAKPNATDNTAIMWIPNRETLTEICRKLKAYYNKVHGLSYVHIETIVHKLRNFIVLKGQKEFVYLKGHVQSFFNNTVLFNSTSPHLYTAQYLQELVHDALNYISIKLRSAWKFNTTVWNEGDPSISFLIGTKDDCGIIIAAQYNRTVDDLVEQAVNKSYLLRKYKEHLRISTFLGLALDVNRTIDMNFKKETCILPLIEGFD